MSLASWKKEFYRTPANKVSKGYALRHSIRKWTGLLAVNRKKHKVFLQNCTLFEIKGYETLTIDGSSCSLCRHHEKNHCETCPVVLKTGTRCFTAYEKMSDLNRVGPMVNLLKKALTKRGSKNENKKSRR